MVVDSYERVCPQCGRKFELLYCKVEDYVYKEFERRKSGKLKIIYLCSYSCRQAYRRKNDINTRTNRERCEKSSSVCKTR